MIDTKDVTDNLDDNALIALYHRFTEPFSKLGFIRMGRLLQEHHRFESPVPWKLLEEIRTRALSWTRLEPKLVWSDPSWAKYKIEAPRAKKKEFAMKSTVAGDAYKTLRDRNSMTFARLDELRAKYFTAGAVSLA